jgi:phosphoglucosamine mutase
MLSAALAAGLAGAGCRVLDAGVLPTPGVSSLVAKEGYAGGAIVSASHNPFHDNGIKLVGADGKKLAEATERRIEAGFDAPRASRPSAREVGRIDAYPDAARRYAEGLAEGIGESLRGLRLVLDCANGATSALAPELFRSLGCDVQAIHADPDGFNINAGCGSTNPESLREAVRTSRADAGLAFDGDGDRVILCDERGNLVTGDHILAICALDRDRRGDLPVRMVVATIMSNAGLELALEAEAIRLLRTDVGDKYVAETMGATGACVGGEQSGHILFAGLSPTGDGMLTAIQTLLAMRRAGGTLSEAASIVQPVPQKLKNLRLPTRDGWLQTPGLDRAIAECRKRLGRDEWLSVRASGTEPLVRVMAQHPSSDIVDEVVERICGLIACHAGAAA